MSLPENIDPFCVRLYASLRSIEYDGELRVSVFETTHLGPEKERQPQADLIEDALDELMTGSRPIQSGQGDRTVEFIWRAPAAYFVLDESYAGPETPIERPLETPLHILVDGTFRGYLRESSYFELMPESAVEYLLITSEAVVKVFAASPPEARVLAVCS